MIQVKKNKNLNMETGQTLIETMVAALVLVMGISAAVGLAIYGLRATSSISNQLIAVGLAREGMEAVKNMRDTNWLQLPMSDTCYDFYLDDYIANCYPEWLLGADVAYGQGYGYNINPDSGENTYIIRFNSNTDNGQNYWQLIPSTNFGLDFESESSDHGFYTTNIDKAGTPVGSATSNFARAITLQAENSFEPFDKIDLGPRLRVRVDVWWRDRNCELTPNPPTASGCKVTLETYLTNWKNY